MKYIFTIMLGLHGLIHVMGFVRAFYLTDINKQVLGLSSPIGALWLIAFILFIIVSSQFYKRKKWFYIAFVAVVISQILIIWAWKDAKFGTIVNLIITGVAVSAFQNYRFDQMIENEIKAMTLPTVSLHHTFITKNHLQNLPDIVAIWLQNSGVLGKAILSSVRLKQKGKMRTNPNNKWMRFEASQYFNVVNPSFVWSTTVQVMPVLQMKGRDKLVNGKGEMLIKLAGIIPIVNQSNTVKINSATMIRYLSEICWFPSVALNDYILWEPVDETSAKATFTSNNQSVSGVFKFTRFGELLSFEAERYYGGSEDASLEKWVVETLSFKEFNGIKIPNKSMVTWKLKEGDFHWLTVEVTDIEYMASN